MQEKIVEDYGKKVFVNFLTKKNVFRTHDHTVARYLGTTTTAFVTIFTKI